MNDGIGRVRRFVESDDGPTAVEYAVMLALIVVACIAVVQSLSRNVSATFSNVKSAMSTAS